MVEPRRTCATRILTWGRGSGPASACTFCPAPGAGGVEPRRTRTRRFLTWGGAADRRVLADLAPAPGAGRVEPRRTCTKRLHTWGCGSGPASACRFSGGHGRGGRAATYAHEKIPYLGVGQRPTEGTTCCCSRRSSFYRGVGPGGISRNVARRAHRGHHMLLFAKV